MEPSLMVDKTSGYVHASIIGHGIKHTNLPSEYTYTQFVINELVLSNQLFGANAEFEIYQWSNLFNNTIKSSKIREIIENSDFQVLQDSKGKYHYHGTTMSLLPWVSMDSGFYLPKPVAKLIYQVSQSRPRHLHLNESVGRQFANEYKRNIVLEYNQTDFTPEPTSQRDTDEFTFEDYGIGDGGLMTIKENGSSMISCLNDDVEIEKVGRYAYIYRQLLLKRSYQNETFYFDMKPNLVKNYVLTAHELIQNRTQEVTFDMPFSIVKLMTLISKAKQDQYFGLDANH